LSVNPYTGIKVEIGIPVDDDFDMEREVLPGWKEKIADYFSMENRVAYYEYRGLSNQPLFS